MMEEPEEKLRQVDRETVDLMSKSAIPLLRVALGATYIWFGALKIFGVSPVAGLVEKMAFGVPRRLFVRMMGVWEVGLGVAVLFRLALRLTVLLFAMQLAGTFMVFIAHPRETFRKGNPLLLTQNGEFIIKNLVLFGAVLAVGSTVRSGREEVQPTGTEVPPVPEEVRL